MENVHNSRSAQAPDAVLGIYAKQPRPGAVKTRLCPPLSFDAAAQLYACSLRETVTRLQAGQGYATVLCYAGERDWFAEHFPEVELQPQRGADLGARMADSLQGFLQQGYRRALLVGSDTPDLPLPLVAQAFSALRQSEVVLAPARDGGYVLIGESRHHPALFTEIPWSTDAVLAETLRRLAAQDIPFVQLPGWEDLDDPDSLRRLLQRSPRSATAMHLRQLFSRPDNSLAEPPA